MKSQSSSEKPGVIRLVIANPRRRPGVFGYLWRIPVFLGFMVAFAVLYSGASVYVFYSRGLDKKLPAQRTDLFVPPRIEDNQLSLF